MEDFQDITLICRDCGEEFVWTAGEQRFYQEKGFTNRPTRCASCRSANKARRNSGGGYGDGGGGGYAPGGGGYGDGGGGRSFRPRQQSSVQVESGIAMRGTVLRVLRDRDFGFLGDSDGVEYYFHRSAAYNFDALFEGASVSFETENSPRGPRARRVEIA